MMRFLFLFGLLVANILVWTLPVPHGLTVSFLNIGQGDSIFIEGPTGAQVLVDGGPSGAAVLRELGKQMPFFDHSIDAVVETHPDADHITGLIEVLKRYHVGVFFEPGIPDSTKTSQALLHAVLIARPTHVIARRGIRLMLGGGAYADILYPDTDVSKVKNTNDGSTVLHVVYGETSFMLTGDLPQKQELHLVSIDGKNLQSSVLKAGHHGSKNSSASEFVQAVNPTYGVFSRGCNNRYGHPAPVVVELFRNLNIPMFDTCTQGTITFVSDGRVLARK